MTALSQRILVVLAVVLTVALAAASCFGPTYIVQQYKGPPRSPDTIAILRVNGGDSVRLLVLDGDDVAAPIASDARLHIEMEAGRHVVRVLNANAPNEPSQTIVFQAEPGRVYRIAYADGRTARIFEVDRGSDKRGRDVTAEAEPSEDGAARRRPPPKPAPEAPADDAGVAPFEPSFGTDGG